METESIQVSHHAHKRRAQRNLASKDIAFVLAHGRRLRCAGVTHVFLGRRNIPQEPSLARRFSRLEGTVLVMGVDEDALVIITAYRNREGLKAIRRKTKYTNQSQ